MEARAYDLASSWASITGAHDRSSPVCLLIVGRYAGFKTPQLSLHDLGQFESVEGWGDLSEPKL